MSPLVNHSPVLTRADNRSFWNSSKTAVIIFTGYFRFPQMYLLEFSCLDFSQLHLRQIFTSRVFGAPVYIQTDAATNRLIIANVYEHVLRTQ